MCSPLLCAPAYNAPSRCMSALPTTEIMKINQQQRTPWFRWKPRGWRLQSFPSTSFTDQLKLRLLQQSSRR